MGIRGEWAGRRSAPFSLTSGRPVPRPACGGALRKGIARVQPVRTGLPRLGSMDNGNISYHHNVIHLE